MAEERKTGMDYPEYVIPKRTAHYMRVSSICRKLTDEWFVIQRKLLNRHGKLRK
jgi:hypothetical protein